MRCERLADGWGHRVRPRLSAAGGQRADAESAPSHSGAEACWPGRRALYHLTAANAFSSLRGPSLRVSPHAYNTLDDVRRLIRVLTATIM